jgi:hypothetical protein
MLSRNRPWSPIGVFPARYEHHLYAARRTLRRLLVAANVVPSSLILDTLMKEALSSSETSVLTRATRRNTLEYAILRTIRVFVLGD